MTSSPKPSLLSLVLRVSFAALPAFLSVCGCAVSSDGPTLTEGDRGGVTTWGFPFPTRVGHTITATPDDHRGRTTQRNWDIDCSIGQSIGAVISGAVTVVRDGLPRGAAYGYGNRVCVRNPDSGVEVCHNHLAAASIPAMMAAGCWVRQGDRIGACGNSGYTIALPGGDGSHVDVYAVDRSGANVELPSPTTWTPLASMIEVTSCARPSLEVVSPRGGERRVRGVTGTIRWLSSAVRGGIQIDVYRGGEFFAQLAASDTNDGEIPFEPPRDWALRDDYRICMSAEGGTVWTCAPGTFALVDADGSGTTPDAGIMTPPTPPSDAGSSPSLPGAPDAAPPPVPLPDASAPPLPPSPDASAPPLPPSPDASAPTPPPLPAMDGGLPPPPTLPGADAGSAPLPPPDAYIAPDMAVVVDVPPLPPPPDAGTFMPPALPPPPLDAGGALPPSVDASMTLPSPDVASPDAPIDAPAPVDAAVMPDVTADVLASDVCTVACPRTLRIALSAAAQRECSGGWELVAWNNVGVEMPRSARGEALVASIPSSWVGQLAFGAFCPAFGGWRDWSLHLERPAREADVESITLGGVELSDAETLVCDPPWLPRTWELAWRAQPLVPLESWLWGRCPR